MSATTATDTNTTATYAAATVTPFPTRPAVDAPATPVNPALDEYLAEQNLLAATVSDLRTRGLDALDELLLDEPTGDFGVALLDFHGIGA